MSQKSPLLSGPARDLVLNYLKANLNNSFKDPDVLQNMKDSIVLGEVDSKNFFITEAKETLNCPACYVLIGTMTFDYSTEQNYIEGDHDLATIITAEAVDADDLQFKVETYGRALFKVLDQQDLATSDGRLKVKLISKSIEYGDIMMKNESADRKKFRRDCIFKWKAIHVENRLIP